MLSQLPRDSNSNYSKPLSGVEKLEARLPFSRIPQMPYRAKSMCCLPSMMFAFQIDALWSLRCSLRAYPGVRRDRSRLSLEQLRSPTTSFVGNTDWLYKAPLPSVRGHALMTFPYRA
ncbi:hypothetical protein KOW79_013664 [Hemibagrus wyckioides]|uniref:Uncharacterized protein n=1 Tax=Hemibagrus wyckioides TaxID=337641 RepID=A0A9D3NJB6_9TELE|nr:hypothetical protein KOW79_013664 [Hemibagrus wyckioides]